MIVYGPYLVVSLDYSPIVYRVLSHETSIDRRFSLTWDLVPSTYGANVKSSHYDLSPARHGSSRQCHRALVGGVEVRACR